MMQKNVSVEDILNVMLIMDYGMIDEYEWRNLCQYTITEFSVSISYVRISLVHCTEYDMPGME